MGNIGCDSSAEFGRHSIWQVLIRQNAMYFTQVLSSMVPCSIRGSSTVEENMHVFLNIPDGPRLDRVLLLVVRFRKFILNVQLTMYGVHFSALFFFALSRRRPDGTPSERM
jgi:hypothetical protein